MRPTTRALLAVPLLVPLCTAVRAEADTPRTKRACIESSENAQRLRKAGRLRAASEALVTCGNASCPAIVREACGQWMNEVRDAMPSVVLGARDAEGHDVVDVRVVVDGAKIADALDGRPVELDPGQHDLVFERGGATMRERILVREGERARPITVTFAAREARAAVGASASSAPVERPAPRSGVPAATWILAGVSLVALGGAGALDLSAFGEAECKPTCTDDQVSSIKGKTYAAGALAGVSILSLGAAAYFFFMRPAAAPSRRTGLDPRFELHPSRDGVAASVAGTF